VVGGHVNTGGHRVWVSEFTDAGGGSGGGSLGPGGTVRPGVLFSTGAHYHAVDGAIVGVEGGQVFAGQNNVL